MKNFNTAIVASIQSAKPVTPYYLNKNFKQVELEKMQKECTMAIIAIDVAVDLKIVRQIGLTEFNAYVVKQILSQNLIVFKSVVKQNNGIEEVKLTSLEKEKLVFDLNLN